MPYMIVSDNGKYCVHKQNADKTAGEYLHCYTGEDAEQKAKDYMKALYAAESKDMSRFNSLLDSLKNLLHLASEKPLDEKVVQVNSAFSFTELSDAPNSSTYIDGLAAGSFVSMTGEEVTFEPDDLAS